MAEIDSRQWCNTPGSPEHDSETICDSITFTVLMNDHHEWKRTLADLSDIVPTQHCFCLSGLST